MFFCSAVSFFVSVLSCALRALLALYCSEGSPMSYLEWRPQRATIVSQRAASARSLRSSTPQLSRSSAQLALLQSQACVSAPVASPRPPEPCPSAPQRATLGLLRLAPEPSPRRARARAEGVLRACRGRRIQNKKAVGFELHKWRGQTLTTFILCFYLSFSISFFSTIVPISGSRSTSMYGCKSPFPIGLYV